MKLTALLIQIALLTVGFASNRADAMAAAAMFSVLTVVVVVLSSRNVSAVKRRTSAQRGF